MVFVFPFILYMKGSDDMPLKAYKYRAYPTDEQIVLFNKACGCRRFIWNSAVALLEEEYKLNKKTYTRFADMSRLITLLKQCPGYEFLNEPYRPIITITLKDLYKARAAFFDGCRKGIKVSLPKKKKKRNDEGVVMQCVNNNCRFASKNHFKVPKIGDVRIKNHTFAKGVIKEISFKRTKTGKYFITVITEVNITPKEANENQVGIDLGIKDFVTLSDGTKIDLSKPLSDNLEKLQKLQKKLSKQMKHSKGYEHTRLKIAKVYEKITNIRKYQRQKLSTYLINTNGTICVENLDVINMLHTSESYASLTHGKNRSISEAGWSNFLNMLKYKGEWYGVQVISIDTYFPSSQLCNNCGYQNKLVKDPSIREWTCPKCGQFHDRDINAAINILSEGIKPSKVA